jgi:N-acetylglucosamine-6-sulfatase
MYEESIRIPLLVRYPRLARAGTVVSQMVLNQDLAPTLLDIAGTAPLPDVTGRSFAPLFTGATSGWRSAFVYEYNYEKQFPYTPNVRGVRTDRWKLIRYPNGDGSPDRFTAELYDLQADPYEQRNLISDPAHAEQRRQMERLLEERSRDAGADRMPVYEGIVHMRPKY